MSTCPSTGVCCGWEWAALDATCPLSGSLALSGPPNRSLYAGAVDGVYAIVLDGGPASIRISPSADATLDLASIRGDGGLQLISLSSYSTLVYEVTPEGATPLPAFSGSMSIFGAASADGRLFLSQRHGAVAESYPPAGSWTQQWSHQVASYMDLEQAVGVGMGDGAVAVASQGNGAMVFSAATGAFCYTDACLDVDSGSPVVIPNLLMTGIAGDPSTGNLYLVGSSASGGLIEGLDPSGQCLFLRSSDGAASGTTSYPYGGPCEGRCVSDGSLTGVLLERAAYSGGVLFATGTATVVPTSQAATGIYTFAEDAGLQLLLSDHAYFAVTAGP